MEPGALGARSRPESPDALSFDHLAAPAKRLVRFEKSGQEPFADEVAKLNAAIRELVRPMLGPGLMPVPGG